MKPIKLLMIVTAAALITFGLGGYTLAFHEGGVAHCDGCHTMHNSQDGQTIIKGGTVGTTGKSLTIGAGPSSTCLQCHARNTSSYAVLGIDTDVALLPGGDFIWIKKTFTWSGHGGPSEGDTHGHNVIATDFGLDVDTINQSGTAPGGTFPVGQLECSSCHDPHGKKTNKEGPIEESGSYGADPNVVETGNYRLLADVGYKPGGTTITFTNPPPIATTASFGDFNSSPTGGENDTMHTDYGQGMSEWCGNCHTQFLASGASGQLKHPNGNSAFLGDLAENYNQYIKTGDFNGTSADSYLSLVPFERHTSDPTVPSLDPTSDTGPSTGSNVMCLTCHRAHASAFPDAGRWDFTTELPFHDYHPSPTDGGYFANAEKLAYYNRDIDGEFDAQNPVQRSLCNKCHVQD